MGLNDYDHATEMNYLYIGEPTQLYRDFTSFLGGGKIRFRCELIASIPKTKETLEDILELGEDLAFIMLDVTKKEKESLKFIDEFKKDVRFRTILLGLCGDVLERDIAIKAVQQSLACYFVAPLDKVKIQDFVKKLLLHVKKFPPKPKPPILEDEAVIRKKMCIDNRTYREFLDLHMTNIDEGFFEIAVSLEMFDPHSAHVTVENLRERAEKVGATRLCNALDLLDTVLFSDRRSVTDRALKNVEIQTSLFVEIARDRLRQQQEKKNDPLK